MSRSFKSYFIVIDITNIKLFLKKYPKVASDKLIGPIHLLQFFPWV